jgi:hypothetical protein
MKTFFYNITYGIQNLIRYFSIIWNDRNWDFGWFYILMRRKIELMRKDTEKYDIHEKKYRCIKYMKICERLLEILESELKDDKWVGYEYQDKAKRLLFKILDHKLHSWWY